MKGILFFLLMLLTFQSAYSQKYSLSGYVEDLNTGERLIGAYVIDSISKSVAQTNSFGYYNLKNIERKSSIYATFIGLSSKRYQLSIGSDTILIIKMQPVMELKEVVITSSQYIQNANAPLGLTIIPVSMLKSIPSLGESDLVKSIQSQPGIKGGVEGSAGIFVRGGGGGENLFMIDDVPIYNVSHLYGFFSAFNSSAVKDIKVLKGNFPARYGGRASSVIDVRSRDGNNRSLAGNISVGIISSNIAIEGPFLNDKTTFLISGRRSYFDLYSEALKNLKLLDENFPGYYFYDLNARFTHTISQRDKIYISLYKGKDNIQNKNENTFLKSAIETIEENTEEMSGWGNFISSLRWNHTFKNKLFSNTTIAFSHYDYFMNDKYNGTRKDSSLDQVIEKNYSAKYSSDISDFIINTDLEYSVSNTHKILFGAGNTIHTINPGQNIYSVNDQEINLKIDTSYVNDIVHFSEPFLYMEYEIKTKSNLKFNTGLRLSGFLSNSKKDINIEPRLSANYSIQPTFVIKTGYSRMVQYMHLLSNSGLIMPTDLWIPSLRDINPLKSDQINFGISYEFYKIALISIEIYQKFLYNTTDFRNGSSLLSDLSPWYEKTTQGHGNSKGLELSIDKQTGHFTGSINYTLSNSSRSYPDINNGQTFPFRYDRLHDFNISVNYKITQKWDISALWIYGTGYPVTIPIEQYSPALGVSGFQSPRLIYYFPSRNNFRLQAYHRLDLGLHYVTENKLGEHIVSIDVFNAYNRKNPISLYFYQYPFKYSYLLPFIPSISYTLKFK